PTATSTGQPATAAFCTSSNESRPLTHSIASSNGSWPAPKAQPITLSIALCRPTSSRAHRSSPSAEKSAVACNPPVAANAAWASPSRSGSETTSSSGTCHCDSTCGESTATASSAPFPQTPQDDDV